MRALTAAIRLRASDKSRPVTASSRSCGLRERELSGKESRLAVQDFEVARGAAPVAHVRQPGRVFGGICQLLLLDPDLLAFPIADERIGHFAKRLLHRALIDERRLLRAGFGKPDAVSNSAAFEDRLQRAGAEGPQPCGTCEQPGERGALISADGGQRDLREIVCLGDADLCVRRDQLLLRLEDVRAAFEQRRRKSRRNLRRMWLVDERPPSSDAFGISSDEDADEVFLLFDPPFEIRDRGPRAEHELFGLPHVEHGGGAAVRKELRQAQRVLPRRERLARDLQFEVLFAQLEIGARHIADERTDDLTLRPLLRREGWREQTPWRVGTCPRSPAPTRAKT